MLEKSLNIILSSFLDSFGLDGNLCLSNLTLAPLKGGKSSATLFQFDVNNSRYVLRLPPANASLLTKTHQSILAKLAAELGIGPKVCYIDPEFKGLILEYIPGTEAQPKDFENLNLIDKMARLLRKLHQANQAFPIATSPFKRFNDFLQKSTYQHTQLNKMKSYMGEIEQTLRFYPVSLAPTHLDLHLSNIILKDQKEIFLVDWVNGGMSDPFFDLATFSYFAELNEDYIQRFLTSYFERAPNEIEKARFDIIMPVRLLVIAASFLANASNSSEQSEFYLEKSIELIESDIFKRSLKQLQKIAIRLI